MEADPCAHVREVGRPRRGPDLVGINDSGEGAPLGVVIG